jgi:hypothetical protein
MDSLSQKWVINTDKYSEQRNWHKSCVATWRERSSKIFEMLKQVWFSEGRKEAEFDS